MGGLCNDVTNKAKFGTIFLVSMIRGINSLKEYENN